jgi:hypothetical protein
MNSIRSLCGVLSFANKGWICLIRSTQNAVLGTFHGELGTKKCRFFFALADRLA